MNAGAAAFAAGMSWYEQANRRQAALFFGIAAPAYHNDGNAEGECRSLIMWGESLRMLNDIQEAGELLHRAADIAEERLSPAEAQTKAYAFSTYGNFLTNTGQVEEALNYNRRAVDSAQDADSEDLKSNVYLLLGVALEKAHQWKSARRPLVLAAYHARRAVERRTRCNAFLEYGRLLKSAQKIERAKRWLEKAARLSLEQPDLQLRCNCCCEFGSISRDVAWLRVAAEAGREIEDAHTACNAFLSYASVLGEPEKNEWLRRAAARLSQVADPHTRLMIQEALIDMLHFRGQWPEVLRRSIDAVSDLLAAMRHNPFVDGVGAIAKTRIVPYGVYAANQLQRTHAQWNPAGSVLPLLDSCKCVAIREGLRRHIEGQEVDGAPAKWSDGPSSWTDAFSRDWFSGSDRLPPRAGSGGSPEERAIRGYRPAGSASVQPADYQVLELPSHLNHRKNAFCELSSSVDLLDDKRTLLLYFGVVGDDLVVMPLHRESSEVAILELGREGLIWIRGARPRLEELVRRQRQEISTIGDLLGRGASLSQLSDRVTLRSLYRSAFELIDGDNLLEILARRIGSTEDMHAVVIPDGPLSELPMHAFVVDSHSKRLYECFQSLRYGLSFKTLSLQATVQQTNDAHDPASTRPRLCVFANPDRKYAPLKGVVEETGALVELLKEIPGAHWRVHGDTDRIDFRATRANFQKWHGAGNLLWVCGHGGEFEDVIAGRPIMDMALLLCDGDAVGPSRFLHDAYDFRNVELFVASSCLLGRISDSRNAAQAFNASLALRGCRRVTSSLWELSDHGATVFAKEYMLAILKHAFEGHRDAHSYAKAYTEALRMFRHRDGGRFNHEFLWAPYTYYGLG